MWISTLCLFLACERDSERVLGTLGWRGNGDTLREKGREGLRLWSSERQRERLGHKERVRERTWEQERSVCLRLHPTKSRAEERDGGRLEERVECRDRQRKKE